MKYRIKIRILGATVTKAHLSAETIAPICLRPFQATMRSGRLTVVMSVSSENVILKIGLGWVSYKNLGARTHFSDVSRGHLKSLKNVG